MYCGIPLKKEIACKQFTRHTQVNKVWNCINCNDVGTKK